MAQRDELPPYRDIRSDIKDRLREAVGNQDFHLAKATEFGDEVAALTKLLDREEARFLAQKSPASSPKEPEEPLNDFILRMLRTRPMSKDDLRGYADRAGYQGDGRSIHATVVNLTRTGQIKEISDGLFAIANYEAAPLPLVSRRV